MTKIVELRQDGKLMSPDFDGYKLSLDRLPVFRQGITCSPRKTALNDEQYSLLHAELFASQNLLVVDPWARTQAYFITCLGEVIRCAYNENKGRPDQQQIVYRSKFKLGEHCAKLGDYNFSFRFLSEKLCLLCDGVKNLSLFETGDRLKATQWTLVASCKIEGSGIPVEERNYVIFDSRLDIIQEHKQISVILGHIQRVESVDHRDNPKHFLYLHWIKWTLEDSEWKYQLIDTLECKGWVYYCAFEPKSESVVISSKYDLKWLSEKSKKDFNQTHRTHEEILQLHGETAVENREYAGISWSQTDEYLLVKLEITPGKKESDYCVRTAQNNITIKCNDKVFLDNELFDKIDPDLTTWTLENNVLQITLTKHKSAYVWTSLLASDVGPKEKTGRSLITTLPIEQQPIASLETPVEDCDFPMDTANDEISVARFNLYTRTITHIIMLGPTPPLFATSLRPGFPYALATRQGVDCCLYLQHHPSKPQEWSLWHEGTLPAFGYVQASKQQKKLVDCSPDLGYAVIAETQRHVFLYKTKYDTASGLRNRNGPKIKIGKQHLIALEDAGEILGLTTANNVVTLLTEKNVYFIQVES